MRRVQLFASASISLALAGCATSTTNLKDESILDVLDESRSSASPPSSGQCRAGFIAYCDAEFSANPRCECMEYSEIQRRLEVR